MAALFSVNSGYVALVANTAKTFIELGTNATIDNVWTGLEITFNGVTAAAEPVKVEIISLAATGTGTVYTPTRYGTNQGRAALTTAKVAMTVEGTGPSIITAVYVPPTSGLSSQWPLGRELGMTVSKFYGVRLTAVAAVNASVNLIFEE